MSAFLANYTLCDIHHVQMNLLFVEFALSQFMKLSRGNETTRCIIKIHCQLDCKSLVSGLIGNINITSMFKIFQNSQSRDNLMKFRSRMRMSYLNYL